ncbi:MAG: CapA family protein [Desulfurispora sp.]|uniref:CapA family protein n=1 Tax=Desulfurispora sp. TaxID=3014275 RepID=UPI00404B7910
MSGWLLGLRMPERGSLIPFSAVLSHRMIGCAVLLLLVFGIRGLLFAPTAALASPPEPASPQVHLPAGSPGPDLNAPAIQQEPPGVPAGPAGPGGTPLPGKEVPEEPPRLTISLLGDILLGERIASQAARYGPDYPWQAVRPYLTGDHFTVGNLECPVSTRGVRQQKQFTFRAPPALLAGMKKAGVEAVTLANNHILDYWHPALLDTLQHLKKAGLDYAGAGPHAAAAGELLIKEVQGSQIGVLAFSGVVPAVSWVAGTKTPGVAALWPWERTVQRVAQAARQVDILIVSLHWGQEAKTVPEKWQVHLAHRLVEAGADVILGHHSHVLQGVEVYKGRPVIYSAGNFLFTRSRLPLAWRGAIFQVDFKGDRPVELRVIPTVLGDGRVQLADSKTARQIYQHLEQVSRPWGLKLAPDGRVQIPE